MLVMQVVLNTAYGSLSPRLSLNLTVPSIHVQLADEDAEINPLPTGGGGHWPEPELDRLSNILKTFNEQFGGYCQVKR